jgi:hypothetical protein
VRSKAALGRVRSSNQSRNADIAAVPRKVIHLKSAGRARRRLIAFPDQPDRHLRAILHPPTGVGAGLHVDHPPAVHVRL